MNNTTDLNARVAIEVMGWKRTPDLGADWWETPLGVPVMTTDKWDTLIADAWQVVEKMREDGFDDWCVSFDEVYFSKGLGTDDYLFGQVTPCPYGENIPEAICLAALIAKGDIP